MIQEGYMLGLPNLGTPQMIRSRIAEIVSVQKTDQFIGRGATTP
ncbi:hypothetical protein ABK249_21100 [Neorhizobium sp. Rsf11]|uniref:Uncharacterized protein n=1 Tax=Neorhizobium phenanthreniclasticum TaxID=3157917 RepID=A0ABV0M6C0_9HYPH